MRSLFPALAMIAVATPCAAMSTVTSTQLSCSAIHARVQREGAVLLRYTSKRPPGLTIYDRVVADRDGCFGSGYGEQTYFPAADTQSCRVWICNPSTDRRP